MNKREILNLAANGFTLTAAIAAIDSGRPELLATIADTHNRDWANSGDLPLNSQRLGAWVRAVRATFPSDKGGYNDYSRFDGIRSNSGNGTGAACRDFLNRLSA